MGERKRFREIVEATPGLSVDDSAVFDVPPRLIREFGDDAFSLISELIEDRGFAARNPQLEVIASNLGYYGDGVPASYLDWAARLVCDGNRPKELQFTAIATALAQESFWRGDDYYAALLRLLAVCEFAVTNKPPALRPNFFGIMRKSRSRFESLEFAAHECVRCGKLRAGRWCMNWIRFEESTLLVEDRVVDEIRRAEARRPDRPMGFAECSDREVKWLLAKERHP